MTLDSLPDLDTSGLCLVKTLSTALTCWPYRNTALRDGARTSTRTSSVAQREDGLDTLPARAAEANRSTLIADIPFPALKTSQPSGARAKTSVLNPSKRLNVVQRPKPLFEPQRSMTSRS